MRDHDCLLNWGPSSAEIARDVWLIFVFAVPFEMPRWFHVALHANELCWIITSREVRMQIFLERFFVSSKFHLDFSFRASFIPVGLFLRCFFCEKVFYRLPTAFLQPSAVWTSHPFCPLSTFSSELLTIYLSVKPISNRQTTRHSQRYAIFSYSLT